LEDVSISKRFTWSQQVGIAVGCLVDAERNDLVEWTKEVRLCHPAANWHAHTTASTRFSSWSSARVRLLLRMPQTRMRHRNRQPSSLEGATTRAHLRRRLTTSLRRPLRRPSTSLRTTVRDLSHLIFNRLLTDRCQSFHIRHKKRLALPLTIRSLSCSGAY